MDNSVLENVPYEYKALYLKHWNTIRTRITRGKIKYVYHFVLTENYSPQLISEYLEAVKLEHVNGCKLNAAFGFILKNVESQELRFFHPSNNTMIFEIPRLIQNNNDYKTLLNDLEREDVLEYGNTQRPSTKWRVAKVVCMRFDVYKITSS